MIDLPARDCQVADLFISAANQSLDGVPGEGGPEDGEEKALQEEEEEEGEDHHQGAHGTHGLTVSW